MFTLPSSIVASCWGGAASGFVIVWESDAEFNDAIVGQLFDDIGTPVGNNFPVSDRSNSQRNPRVARIADDGFVVVWQDSEGDNIFGRVFDAQGNPGTQGQVNLYSENSQEFPAIASDAEGNFVVVYESFKFPTDNDGEAIVGRLFSSTATQLTAEILINTTRSGDQQNPAVGRQPGGDFLVAWESDDLNNTGIWAQIMNSSGEDVSDQFLVNNIQENNQEFAAVGAWSGGYVVAWESTPDFEGRGIFARRFDSNGIPLGDQFLVNTIQDRDQKFPSVSVFDSGEFVIAWQDDDLGAMAREYGADGDPLADQFLVSASDAFQRQPRVAVRDGGFLITWFGGGAEIDDDILGRSYSVPEPSGLCGFGLYRDIGGNNKFFLDSNQDGTAENNFVFGPSDAMVYVGAWDGNGDYPGIRREINGNAKYFLNTDFSSKASQLFVFGPTDSETLTGDFNGDNRDNIGFRKLVGGGAAKYFLDHGDGQAAEESFQFGNMSDPAVVGNWDGNGGDNIGIVQDIGGIWKWKLRHDDGSIEIFSWGNPATETPVTGDWDGDGRDDPGLISDDGSGGMMWKLNHDHAGGPEETFVMGKLTDTAAVCDWDGDGADDPGFVEDDAISGKKFFNTGPEHDGTTTVRRRFGDSVDGSIWGTWPPN